MYAASHENARRRAFYHQQQRNKKRANDLAVYLAERQRRQPVDVELDRETARRDLLDHGIEDVLIDDIRSMYDDNRKRVERVSPADPTNPTPREKRAIAAENLARIRREREQ